MRHQQVPDDRLNRLRVRRDVRRIYCWHQHARVGDPGCVATVAANNTDHRHSQMLCIFEGCDEIWTDVLLSTAAAVSLAATAVAGGTWTYTGSLNTARRDHTATLLDPNVAPGASGKVLVAG